MLGTPKGLSDEKAARMMVALREGRTLRTFGVKSPRLEAYFNAHPEFAQEALPLIEENKRAARLRKGARLREQTHCKHGHLLSGVNISFEPNGRRKCLTCVDRRNLAPRPPTQQQIEQVTAALNAGKPLRLICQGMVGAQRAQPRIVSFRKLGLYRRLNPTFDQCVVSATADNNRKGQQRRFRLHQERTDAIRSENNDYYNILGILPRNLPPDVRDDIAQSIMVALLEGSLQRDQVSVRVQQFARAHNCMFPPKHAKFGDRPLVSLDEVLFEDGSTTRGDTVSLGLWD